MSMMSGDRGNMMSGDRGNAVGQAIDCQHIGGVMTLAFFTSRGELCTY